MATRKPIQRGLFEQGQSEEVEATAPVEQVVSQSSVEQITLPELIKPPEQIDQPEQEATQATYQVCKGCRVGKPNDRYKYCHGCRTRLRAKTKAWQAKQSEHGKCKLCPNPPEDGYRYCAACREAARQRHRQNKVHRQGIKRYCKQCNDGPLPARYSYCAKCRSARVARARRHWCEATASFGDCTSCCKPLDRAASICSRCAELAMGRRVRLKQQCMDMYGGRCACCGAEELSFLSLDHVNNDGAAQRKAGQTSGYQLYRQIVKNGRIDDLQCMCFNCQMSKRILGTCIHQQQATMTGEGCGI